MIRRVSLRPQAACSRTAASGCSRAASSKSALYRGFLRFARTVMAFRESPSGIARLTGEPLSKASQVPASRDVNCSSDVSLQRAKRQVARLRSMSSLVIRAYVLANVAPKEMLAYPRAQLLGHRPSKLDGEVRDASARIEHERGSNAAVGHASRHKVQLPQRSAMGTPARERESRHHLAEQENERAQPGRDDQAILADESEPSALRPGALEYRGVVADGARTNAFPGERADERREPSQTAAQVVMVIAPARVAGDVTRHPLLLAGRFAVSPSVTLRTRRRCSSAPSRMASVSSRRRGLARVPPGSPSRRAFPRRRRPRSAQNSGSSTASSGDPHPIEPEAGPRRSRTFGLRGWPRRVL